MIRELKLTADNLPPNKSGYMMRRSEILASLGAIDYDIVTVIHRHGMRSAEYQRLDNRRSELESELISLDTLNQNGRFPE